MIEIVAHISTGSHTARIVMHDDVVVEGAAFLKFIAERKWTRAQVRGYCKQKGWKVEVISRTEREK